MSAALNFSLPEDLLSVNQETPAGIPIDAITCAVERANAVLLLLEDQFEVEQGQRLANRIILGALWDVRGTLELIRTLALHAAATTRVTVEGGAQ